MAPQEVSLSLCLSMSLPPFLPLLSSICNYYIYIYEESWSCINLDKFIEQGQQLLFIKLF